MDLAELIHPGMTREDTFLVEEKYLAPHVGSGSLRVLATPWLIGFMEATAHRLLTCCLPEGQSSVGVRVDMRHLAPTPLGDTVRIQAQVLTIAGNLVDFSVRAWDSRELIGECQHQRAVIDVARFLKRVALKSAEAG